MSQFVGKDKFDGLGINIFNAPYIYPGGNTTPKAVPDYIPFSDSTRR